MARFDKIWQDLTRSNKIWQDQIRFISSDRIWEDSTRINEIWQDSTRIDKHSEKFFTYVASDHADRWLMIVSKISNNLTRLEEIWQGLQGFYKIHQIWQDLTRINKNWQKFRKILYLPCIRSCWPLTDDDMGGRWKKERWE